jgi:transposase-like protein
MAARKSGGAESRWRALIAEQERSGESVAGFASSRGLCAATIYWWRSRLRRQAQSDVPDLVPIEITTGAPPLSESFELELVSGRRLRVPASFDADALARLILVAERAC